MQFVEVETKYNANNISSEAFNSICLKLNPKKITQVSSYDHYYEKKLNDFIRFRTGSHPELTIKKKTKDTNNFVRVEVNLPLSQKHKKKELFSIVNAFCTNLGYSLNFTILKKCVIYHYDKYNIVYYTVYDKSSLINKFIEIEMDEKFKWKNEAEAWSSLLKIERSLKCLGISKRLRLNLSLYEMFRIKNGQ